MDRFLFPHNVRIEQASRVKNTLGEDIDAWLLFALVWANVESLSGREIFQAQQVKSLVTHRVRMRFLPGVKSEMRIRWDKRVFEIESVINSAERNRELELLCVEKAD